jgi:hypothetical protein
MSQTDQNVKQQIRPEQTAKHEVITEQTTKPEIHYLNYNKNIFKHGKTCLKRLLQFKKSLLVRLV